MNPCNRLCERFGGFNLNDTARVPLFRKRNICLNIHFAHAERKMTLSAARIVNMEMPDAIQMLEQKRLVGNRCGL